MITFGALFVDVRETGETENIKYDLPNIIYLPLSQFENKFMAFIPQEKNTKIILACMAGGRSMMAAGCLERNGYQNLFNLEGGLSKWISENYPIKNQSNSNNDCCSKPGCC